MTLHFQEPSTSTSVWKIDASDIVVRGSQLQGTRVFLGEDSGSLGVADGIESEFNALQKKWKEETVYFSSAEAIYLHEGYVRIIGLGPTVVPYILRSMSREPDHWFLALRALTGANPVTDAMAGDIRQMTNAWLAWGRRMGLIG